MDKPSAKQFDPYKVLMSSIYKEEEELTAIQASDEIVTIFVELHGGLEEAMPIIRHQFEKNGVDFSDPTKTGLIRIADSLVKITEFLKGRDIAEAERKRFAHLIRCIRKERKMPMFA